MHIARQSARGSVVLFVGNLGAAAIAAVASIIVARLLGPNEYGLYALALAGPSLLQYCTHFGTRTAVPRYIAYHTSRGESDKARKYAQASLFFALVTGIVFTIGSIAGSGWIADLLQRPSLQPYVALASLIILGQSLLLTSIAASTGWNAMGQASLSNVVQSGFRAVASPLLIILGFGIGGAVVGHATSYLVAGVASAGVLYFARIRPGTRSISEMASNAVELIRFGFPPFIANLLTGVSVFYTSLLLSIVANNATVGYYQAATSLVIPATLLSTSTTSALYPAFASLQGISGDLNAAFRLSVKYVGYLIVPILFFLATSSRELMRLFYGKSFVPGSFFLVLFSLSYAPILVGLSVLPYFFNGIGRPRLTLYATGSSIAVLFVTAPLLSIFLGLKVQGLIYSIFISNAVLAAMGLAIVWRRKMGSIDVRSALAVLFSSGISLLTCSLIPSLGSDLLNLLAKFLVFAAIYLTLAPILGAVNKEDVERIASSLRELRIIGPLLAPFLQYEMRLAS